MHLWTANAYLDLDVAGGDAKLPGDDGPELLYLLRNVEYTMILIVSSSSTC